MATRLTTIIVLAIVAATLIAGLIVGAQREDNSERVDLIVFNGKVYVGAGKSFAEAIAVRGSKILRVGTNREIQRLRRFQTTVIDARGGSVLPAFNDAHAHLLQGGLSLDHLNLLDADTSERIGLAIRTFAETHPERTWIRGRGWHYGAFPGGLPTRQQLDALVADRPAYLVCYDGHTGWANSKALALAGITRRTHSPKHGVIVKDPRTGEPTGILKETAQALIERVLPAPTPEERRQAVAAAIREAHRVGITSVQNAGEDLDELELYEELRRSGDLKLRVYSALATPQGLTEADADRFDAVWRRFTDDPRLKTGAVKLVGDGVIEAHTAALLEPYATKPTSGAVRYSPDELRRVVSMFDKRGWQIVFHASGDAAVRAALDAYERAAEANPLPARGRRHRIEHLETIDPTDVPRFGRLGVIATEEPSRRSSSPAPTDVWQANLGATRAARGRSWAPIKTSGGRLAFGSDWPAVPMDPLLGLYAAVAPMTTADDTPEDGWSADERLPLAAAIDAYTTGGAYASFEEHRKGTLARGMLADLVVLSTNLFEAPPDVLRLARVETTIFDGKVVYQRPSASTKPEQPAGSLP